MGCDIHVYVEYKNKNTGKWVLGNPEFPNYQNWNHEVRKWEQKDGALNWRNYELFSLLAGVRGWNDPLVEPRGLPYDMSDELAAIYKEYETDWHTPTWYDMNELYNLRKMLGMKLGYEDEIDGEPNIYWMFHDFVTIVGYLLDMNGANMYEPGNARVVFWFDS